MNTVRLLGASLVLAGAVSGAWADEGLTRAQVRAETLAAQRAGDIPQGDLDIKPNMVHPDSYPAKTPVAGKTRTEVRAELAQAIASGDVVVGDSDRTLRDINPGRYPQPTAVRQGDDSRMAAELPAERHAAAEVANETSTRRYATN